MGIVILLNLIWILLGYLIGSLNFSIILTKNSNSKKNIKEIGSGNAGATNAMRAYGFKFGLIVFILDTSKSYWFGFILGALQRYFPAFQNIIPQLALMFVIVGHIFPIYFNFKGGKGASSLLGMIAAISLILAAIGTVIFFIVIWRTRYVSLGSISVPFILVALSFMIPIFNHIDTTITYGDFWVSPLFLFLSSFIVFISHHENIKRLLNRNENKISFGIFEDNNLENENNNNINNMNENKYIKNEKKQSLIDKASNSNFNL